MTNEPARQTLLADLEARQDELLAELDQLNSRIEEVLRECLVWRGSDGQSLPAAA